MEGGSVSRLTSSAGVVLARDTPMDYDDNDFHSQNFHLAGEGSSKFPPVLRPYPLPKFDFDDSLQNHLRFDNLVETEVFLGIESNQDNHWIEDFSRGSSGIEFNSSAAESCSISRHNNVWSEATSSESVEMLLKSVGQEETIVTPTIIEELDACDELGCLTKQMEHSLKHDDNNILSKTEDGTNLNTTSSPDGIVGNSSSSKRDVGVDQPLIEDTSQIQSDEIAKNSSLHDSHKKADNGESVLLVNDGDILVNEKFDDVSKSAVDTLADEQLDVQIQEDSFASRLQVDNSMTTVQSVVSSSTGISRLQVDNSVTTVQSVVSSSTGISGIDIEHQMNAVSNDNTGSQVSSKEEISVVSASKVEAVSDIKEVSKSNVDESLSEVEKGDSELPIVSESNKGEFSGKPIEVSNHENVVLCKNTVDGDQEEVNTINVISEPVKSETQFERPVVEVSNISSEVRSTLEPTKDFVENSRKEDVFESSQQLDGETLVHSSEVYLSPIEDAKVSEHEGLASSNSQMGGISSMSGTCSSVELHSETNVTGVSKGVHDSLETSTEDLSSASHVSLAILTESTQISEKNHAYGEADVYISNQHVSVVDKDNLKLHNDCNVDNETINKEGASSSIGDDKCATAAGSEPVSDSSVVPNPYLAPHEISDSSLPTKDVLKIDDHKDIQVSAVPVVGSTLLEGKEEARTEAFAESSVAASLVSCQVVAAPDSAEKGASCVTAGGLLHKPPDLYLPTENKPEVETNSKDPAAVEVSKECTKEMNIPLHESTVREGGHVMEPVIVPENSKQFIIEKHVLQDAASISRTELTTNKDKMLSPGGPLPLVESGISQKVQDGNGAAMLTVGDKTFAQPNTKRSASDVGFVYAHAFHDLFNNVGSSADHSVPTPGSNQLSQNKHGVAKGGKRKASVSKVIDSDTGIVVSNTIGQKGLDSVKEGKASIVGLSADLFKGDVGKNLQCLPASPAPTLGRIEANYAQNTFQASPQVSDGEHVRGRSKGTSERKPRRSSAKAAGKDSGKKGVSVKETTPARQSEKGDKLSNVSLSPSGIFHIMQSNEMQHYGHVEGNNNKPYLVLASSTSGLPDLNSSAPPSTAFQQPFTDFQQVQLRAQIFVYGALIQGTPPEEGHMLSAFGGSDGGRSMWGNLLQACIERLQNQKTNVVNQETPLHSRHTTSATARTIDHSSKQSALQSKVISTPVGRSSAKGSQAIVSPMIPLSSPLWSVSTPVGDAMQSSAIPRGSVMDYQQTLTPLHHFQTPPMRSLLGPNTSWMPQTSFRGPWVSPPQPSLPEASTRLTTYPGTEAIQLTSVKETAMPHSTGTKHVLSSPMVQTGAPASVLTAVSPMQDFKKVTSSSGQHSFDPRPRKRKKNPVPEEIGQIVLQSLPQSDTVLAPVLSGSLSTSVAITTPASTSEKLVMSASPTSSASLRKTDNVMQRASLSEDTLSKIKEASKHAEDAASLAAAAVGHSQEIWSQLENQKNSGLVSDVEAKLASAAVAVAAAAAVAKAAAAAANVASNAALQAKLMADEAFISNSFENLSQGTRSSFYDGVNVLGKTTPASILRGEDGANSSSSIITVARETARRKVEAASAASKRAENMDAIVRAAELAAEAISQAGKIVAMGDPVPLRELIEAGPEGYWRAPQASSELVAKSVDMDREQSNLGAGEGAHTSAKHLKDGRVDKKDSEKSAISRGMSKESIEEHLRLIDGISGSAAVSEKEMKGQKGRKVSDLTKNIVVVLESDSLSKLSSVEVEKAEDVPGENGIKEGSKVEVYKDGDGFKAGWYGANVLSFNDGKACVSYTEIEQDEGSNELKEWVSLEGVGSDPPKIRFARPVTAMRYEGTRKRRRAAMGDYNWSVGDKVDAWMTNSWWEGVVTERNKKDETSVTVHFPAHGETSVVKAWHLRPSLIWKDGEWVECSNLQTDPSSLEGDLPQEKRLKIGSPSMEAKGKDKVSKSMDILDSGKPQSQLLDLSANDKVFKMGKNARNVSKPDSSRVARTGLQKEGSRVIFGVPKPGKKRKFMEVSKHYVADRSNKNSEANESIKYQKYMAPQGSGSRTVKSDPKEKRMADSKLKGLKSGKQQSVSGRTIPQRNFTTNAVSVSGEVEGTTGELAARDKEVSLSNVDNMSRKQSVMETGSFSTSDRSAEGSFAFSSDAPTLDGPSKKNSVSTSRVERANKGNLAPGSGKLGKIDEDKAFSGNSFKSTSEAIEPRRSNRRIQPTSRLLEGLQSSLVLPKFSSMSHDKGPRAQNRNTPRVLGCGREQSWLRAVSCEASESQSQSQYQRKNLA
ncbi:hypothetical protein G4B88_014588 [Cannabis sativa]|uniref:Agenet domain-containing protein n=1 Tax=Cannabis sativa TaxID=3483 RepID=A0A7J6I954_CANSA|nr:hypothetical protein G4B88_014588 [Cannabis sativa]